MRETLEKTKYCECNCGKLISSRMRFVWGHNGRGDQYVSREIRICSCTKKFECRVTATQRFCSHKCSSRNARKSIQHRSKERIEKISDSVSKLYLKGFRPKTHYGAGWVETRIGEKVYCRSSYEKAAVNILNSFEDIISIKSEALRIPYEIKGIRRYYLPDFLVSTVKGSLYLIEVKPANQILEEKNLIKFNTAIRYAEDHNMEFLIRSEEIVFSNKNGSTTASLQEIVEATAAVSVIKETMIQSEPHGIKCGDNQK